MIAGESGFDSIERVGVKLVVPKRGQAKPVPGAKQIRMQMSEPQLDIAIGVGPLNIEITLET